LPIASIGTLRASQCWRSMKGVGNIPVEVHIACFLLAGVIVSIVYSVDWSNLF
jgi:hypothetical protein